MAALPDGWVTRVERAWMLGPFHKALRKREQETALLGRLDQCVQQLFRDPTNPGLNLETLHNSGHVPVLSARIDRSNRLILVPLAKTELGLLYFDNHDEAYAWVDRNRKNLPTMLAKSQEVALGAPLSSARDLVPVVLGGDESPVALASANHFRQMVSDGLVRYLTFLDEEQRRLAELPASGLLLIKGGAGTGKTAVAIHRLLSLARQPVLFGPTRVLYLCYNQVLARVVQRLIAALCHGAAPREVQASTFHAWCLRLLTEAQMAIPRVDAAACTDAVRQAIRDVGRDRGVVDSGLDAAFVDQEIEVVILHNALASLEEYQAFPRHGRARVKQADRAVVWDVWQRAQRIQAQQNVRRWSELPLLALRALDTYPYAPQYRAVVVDEGQDCSPTMVRLARRLVAEGGSLTVFADPAQTIYDCGFQWTQRELKPHGGNVRWLRTNYRSTRQISDLARPLLDGLDDLQEDLSKLAPPARPGPLPCLLVVRDEAEMKRALADRLAAELERRPPHQVAVLGNSRRLLGEVSDLLSGRGIAAQLVHHTSPSLPLQHGSVKLLTMHGAKGLDFPCVFVLGPREKDLGGPDQAHTAQARRLLYVALTRSSEALTLIFAYGDHHPLLELLPEEAYDIDGPAARAFSNTRGMSVEEVCSGASRVS